MIVGSGAAGAAGAETLRREGYTGPVTLVGAEPPVDRPNLSKDYLAGNAPEEWIPLRDAAFYRAIGVDLVTGDAARSLDLGAQVGDAGERPRLGVRRAALATGAEPVRLPLPGADRPHVHILRTLADSRAIIARATQRRPRGGRRRELHRPRGGGVAARARRSRSTSWRPRRCRSRASLGDELGAFVRAVHEEKGVRFHLGTEARRDRRRLGDARRRRRLPCDFVVMGVGVRPRLALAEAAGLAVDRGVVVDEQLRAAPGVWAAGDVARYPDRDRASRCASSTGWSPSAWARPRRATCWARRRPTATCRSSGARTTT